MNDWAFLFWFTNQARYTKRRLCPISQTTNKINVDITTIQGYRYFSFNQDNCVVVTALGSLVHGRLVY